MTQPKRHVQLKSVGHTFDRVNGMTYPTNIDDTFDITDGRHISEVDYLDDGTEWWESLSPTDWLHIDNYVERHPTAKCNGWDEIRRGKCYVSG